MKGKNDEALHVLNKIHGEESAEFEFQEIKDSIGEEKEFPIKNVLKKAVLPIIIIGSVLSGLQQFTGINAVLYYGADIFEKALGFGQEDVLAQQILLAGVNFIFTFVAMYTVDKWGRKPLIITGSIGMISGFSLLAITLIMDQVGILSLLGVLIFIASFSMSMGPVVWVILSEMFPNSIRSVAMSIAVVVQWACNAIVAQSFPIVVESDINNNDLWNGALPYFIFIVFILLIIWLTKKYIPETKGKSLEELEQVWEDKYGKIS